MQSTSSRRYPFTGKYSKESEVIHIIGIYDGGGWISGCGSHPQSAERVEELEESVWSVVRQKNERDDQVKVHRTVVRPTLVYCAETWALNNAQENKLVVAEMRMLRCMCGVTKLYNICNNKRDNNSGGNHTNSSGKEVEVIMACDEKRVTPSRKEGDGN